MPGLLDIIKLIGRPDIYPKPATSQPMSPLGDTHGTRVDGTAKGEGFLGGLLRPDGSVSTEVSIGTADVDGVEREIPLLVPSLTEDQVMQVLSGGGIQDDVFLKAIEFARQRMAMGLSPFASESEINTKSHRNILRHRQSLGRTQ